jgi:hypothetical protein
MALLFRQITRVRSLPAVFAVMSEEHFITIGMVVSTRLLPPPPKRGLFATSLDAQSVYTSSFPNAVSILRGATDVAFWAATSSGATKSIFV